MIESAIFPVGNMITSTEFCENPTYDSGMVILFDSDEEFEDFCIAPFTKDNVYGDYSETYKKCLDAGMKFVIRSKNSNVCKRGVVVKRVPVSQNFGIRRKDVLVQLPVDNIEDVNSYWGQRFLIGSNIYNRKSIVSRVVYDLVSQGKTPEQICEMFKSCCDSMITSEAYEQLNDEEQKQYKSTKIKGVSYYYTHISFNKFIKTSAEYGILIENIEK